MAKAIKPAIDIEESILKQFGNVIRSPSELKENPPKIIPTTPRMDIMLGGGIPEGSFCVVSGPPGLGKSAISLHIAGNAQKIDFNGAPRKVFYFDIEGRIKRRDIFMNKNLITTDDQFRLIKSSADKIIYGEEFMDIGERLITASPGSVFIFDSFSALCTKARKEGEIGERFRDDSPLLLSAFCKRIAQIIPINKCIIIGITHRIANQGPGMSKWTEASGEKIKYQADIKIKGNFFTDWKLGEAIVGQEVNWECEKAALRGPGGKANCKLRYQHGYDLEAEIADVAIEIGLVRKAGAHIKYGDPEVNYHGTEKFVNFLKENPEEYQKLHNTIFTEYFPPYSI